MRSHLVHWSRRLPLLLTFFGPSLMAQESGTVRGRVTEAQSGEPIADVQVAIDAATVRLGAMTRATGEYTLVNVPTGSQTIVVRRLGYAVQRRVITVSAGETVTADFALTASTTTLGEVLVTGTAAPAERRAVGTSIASIESNAIARAQATTLEQALQGKMAGAQITQNSGNPGGGGISVRLRGTSSFISGSDPLYIVDGVIVDNSSAPLRDLGARSNVQNRMADINPADIERIEIIRGAAAAALYGSRANNGVVQIFTKRGQMGRARVTLNTRVASNELRRRIPIKNPQDISRFIGNARAQFTPLTNLNINYTFGYDGYTME